MASLSERPMRARSSNEKSQRRGDILRAAEQLWTSTPYADLSMNRVAREVKLAKGTLYLYFATREELFLALLEMHYQRWAADTCLRIKEQQPITPHEVADLLASSYIEAQGLRRLQLLSGQVLSQSMPLQSVPFRERQLRALLEVAAALPYKATTALRMVQHAEALCLGWQSLADKVPPAQLLQKYPQLCPLELDTNYEMSLALRAVVRELAEGNAAQKS